MPETRLLAQHQPRPTTLSRAQAIPHPGANATAGSYVSASPAAGGYVQAQVAAARQAAAVPPGVRPPGTRAQDARVAMIPRPGAGHAHAGHGAPGGAMLATNQRPTVQILPKPATSQVHTQIPPGGGVSFGLDEAMLVGQLLYQYVESAGAAKDEPNARLGSRALEKVSANVQILMEMMAQAQAQATQAPAAPQPTRVQVPAHPTSPSGVPGGVVVAAQQPAVQLLPNQTAPLPPPAASWPPWAWPAQPGAPVVVPAWPPATSQEAAGTPAVYPWPPQPTTQPKEVAPAAPFVTGGTAPATPEPTTPDDAHGA